MILFVRSYPEQCWNLKIQNQTFYWYAEVNSPARGQNGRHFGRRHFQMRFIQWKFRIQIPLKFVPEIQLTVSQHWSGNAFAPNRRQAITWTNADPVEWRVYATLWGHVKPFSWVQNIPQFLMWKTKVLLANSGCLIDVKVSKRRAIYDIYRFKETQCVFTLTRVGFGNNHAKYNCK